MPSATCIPAALVISECRFASFRLPKQQREGHRHAPQACQRQPPVAGEEHHGGEEKDFGVTINLTTNYRKPVPYATDLIAKGVVVRETSRFVVVESQLLDMEGTVLADGTIKYIKLDPKVISGNTTAHEEMPYLIDDGVTEL